MPAIILFLLFLALGASQAQISTPVAEESTQKAIESVLKDFDEKKNDEALAKLEALEKQTPGDPLVLNLIGSAYTKKKDSLEKNE